MRDIVILCPKLGKPVATGLTTKMIVLDALDITLSLRCPGCGKIHRWKQKDAWVDEEDARE